MQRSVILCSTTSVLPHSFGCTVSVQVARQQRGLLELSIKKELARRAGGVTLARRLEGKKSGRRGQRESFPGFYRGHYSKTG